LGFWGVARFARLCSGWVLGACEVDSAAPGGPRRGAVWGGARGAAFWREGVLGWGRSRSGGLRRGETGLISPGCTVWGAGRTVGVVGGWILGGSAGGGGGRLPPPYWGLAGCRMQLVRVAEGRVVGVGLGRRRGGAWDLRWDPGVCRRGATGSGPPLGWEVAGAGYGRGGWQRRSGFASQA